MEFLIWHYSQGLRTYLKRWSYIVGGIVHFFSLPLLLLSLFSPYRRLVDNEKIIGVNLQLWFRQFTFNLISRFIGAFVRLFLFLFGLLLIIPAFLVGFIGLIFWLIFPPIGLVYYLFQDPHSERLISNLIKDMKKNHLTSVQVLLESSLGKYLVSRLNIDSSFLLPTPTASLPNVNDLQSVNSVEILHHLIEQGVWDRQHLRQNGVEFADLLITARRWDNLHHAGENDSPKNIYGRPGIGLELLFGYTPTLDKYSTDLTVANSFSHHLIGRGDIVSRMERSISSGRSIVLMGQAGVGKKTIVYEFAKKCLSGDLGKKMAYKRVVEFDYNFLLSKNLDISQKKASLSDVLTEAGGAGNVILVIKDLHRLTHSDLEGLDFTDIFEKHLESGKLILIAISDPISYERFLATNSRLRKHLDIVEAVAPDADQAMDVLIDFAQNAESGKKIIITSQSLRAIIDGSDKYISDTPFPEKALELLDHAIAFVERGSKNTLTLDDVNQVLAERTGISMARLTESEKSKLSDLENLLHQSLVGQDEAISLISKSLRSRAVGAKSSQRPLGSFLFLGPTGVGKTETAKALAKLYYGDQSSILRFDMAEFAGPEGLTRLIGSVSRNQPGLLTTAIKNKPASLLLLDEIEKSPSEVFNIFLSLLDEGQITDAFGNKINCKHLFVIATSNAGSRYIHESLSSSQLSKDVVEYVQKEGLFSPEFLNRFDGVVVYKPLTKEQLLSVAKIQSKALISDLDKQGIIASFTDSAISKIVELGYQPEFGARPMRRVIDMEVGDLVAKSILNSEINSGDRIEISVNASQEFVIKKV